MYQLILKQNNKLGDKFNKISYFLYGSSAVFTLIFSFISWDKNAKDNRHADMYRNIIALNFIVDSNKNDLATVLYAQILYFSLLIFSFVCIILIQIFVKDRENIPSNRESEAESIKDKSIKSSLKLKTFKLKLLAYPFLNFAYIIPLTAYLWIEYAYLENKYYNGDKNKLYLINNISYLRIRYFFYNIYCFMNSIRGFLYFRAFIDNEKIKMYLFKLFIF